MILIPDQNTLLIIKEGNISIEKIKLKVMTTKPYTKFEISFDGIEFQTFTNEMRIPKKFHKVPYLTFVLKCKGKEHEEIYRAQKMPTVVYTMIGNMVEDLYPIAIKKVLDMQVSVNEKIKKLENRIQELEDLGELGG